MLDDFIPIFSVPHILVYKHYRLIEKFPSSVVVDSNLSFAEQCSLFNVELPVNCNYALFFFDGLTIKLKDDGDIQFIILNFNHYGQNSQT